MDKVEKIILENDDFIVRISTQILDEPTHYVILVHQNVIYKKTGKSDLKQISRETIEK